MKRPITPSPLCPLCGKTLDDATGLRASKKVPGPGDLGICLGCGAMLCYTEALGRLDVRILTAKERDELPDEPKDIMIRAQHQIFARGRGEGARTVVISADSTLPHVLVPCDRCDRQMNAPAATPKEVGLKAVTPVVRVCTGCLPHARELEIREGSVFFPKSWAASRRTS